MPPAPHWSAHPGASVAILSKSPTTLQQQQQQQQQLTYQGYAGSKQTEDLKPSNSKSR
ncbi:unnamed protein product [Prunus brigantina]